MTGMILCVVGLLLSCGAFARDIYVRNGGSATSPFDSPAKATTSLADAFGVLDDGDTLHIADGEWTAAAALQVTKAATVVSDNGPDALLLKLGAALTVNNANAVLSGLTIRFTANVSMTLTAGTFTNSCIRDKNGRYPALYIKSGGTATHCRIINNTTSGGLEKHVGVVMDGGVLTDSVVSNNYTGADSSGVFLNSGTPLVRNCLISGNTSTTWPGAGIYIAKNVAGTVESCTVANNQSPAASACGGIYSAATSAAEVKHTIRNTIAHGNKVGTLSVNTGGAHTAHTNAYSYSLAPELPYGANGNIAGNPYFMDTARSDFRLDINSPAIDSGSNQAWMSGAVDLAGAPRATAYPGLDPGTVDMGCYETSVPSNAPLRIACGYTPETGRTAQTVTFKPVLAGANTNVTWFGWDFDGDGAWEWQETATPVPASFDRLLGVGSYPWVFAVSNSVGEYACITNKGTLVIHPLVYYLREGGAAVAPYDTEAKAATSLLPLVNYVKGASESEEVVIDVGASLFESTAIVQVQKAVRIRGAAAEPGSRLKFNGSSVRIELLHSRAVLDSLKITAASNVGYGLVFINPGVVTNCVIYGYNGLDSAVKITGGTLTHSWFTNNFCRQGSESSGCLLVNAGALVQNCVIVNNESRKAGGAIQMSGAGVVRNCLIAGNRALGTGGGGIYADGATGARVESCTVTANTAPAGYTGAGIYSGATALACTNTIVYGNFLANLDSSNVAGVSNRYAYCLAPELPHGVNGNIVGNPRFVNSMAGDYRLDLGSPCIDTGTNHLWLAGATDLDGRPRATAYPGDTPGVVDMGCYEASLPPNAPLQIAASFAPSVGRTSLNVTFMPLVAGANTNVAWFGWDFDGDGAWDWQQTATPVPASFERVLGVGTYPWIFGVSNSVGEYACITNGENLTVHPLVYYLRHGGAALPPYDTEARAATSFPAVVQYAYGAAESEEVMIDVGPGVFTNNASVQIAKALRVSGATAVSGSGLRLVGTYLNLAHPRAIVERLAITSTSSSGMLFINSGTVTNCTLHDYNGVDSAVKMYGGLLTHSRFINNTSSQGGVETESCLVINSGALAQYCEIANNQSRKAGGAVQLKGSGAIRNSLVYGNKTTGSGGGGIFADGATGGRVEACTVVSNTCPVGYGGAGIYSGATALACTNTIIYGNFLSDMTASNVGGISNAYAYCLAPELAAVPNNLAVAPLLFRNGAGEWRLERDSPCRNAGTPLASTPVWMLYAADFWGGPRIAQKRPDIGAEELPPARATIMLLR